MPKGLRNILSNKIKNTNESDIKNQSKKKDYKNFYKNSKYEKLNLSNIKPKIDTFINPKNED